MTISKTQFGWMALGGMLCLFGIVLTCKVKEGNRASAHSDDGGIPLVAPVPPSEKPPVAEVDKKDETSKARSEDSTNPPAPSTSLTPLGTQDRPLPMLKEDTKEPVRATAEGKPTLPPPLPIGPSILVPAPGASSDKAEYSSPRENVLADPPPAPPTAAPNIPQPIWPASVLPGAPGFTVLPAPVSRVEFRTEGEPPLAPRPGPIQVYHVKHDGETPREIARRTLGASDRWEDVIKLNPNLKPDVSLSEGTMVRLPADACIPVDEVETVKPLPVLRKPAQGKTRVLPLTGTFPCNLDEKHTLILPRAIRDQLGNCDTVLVSPGPDHCLWVTNHAHLERLAERLEHSPALESEVRVFRRLYYAQTEKIAITVDGRVQVPEKLVQFAGLHQEVVLVGIDDHFELWDVAHWKLYTQQKSAAFRGLTTEE